MDETDPLIDWMLSHQPPPVAEIRMTVTEPNGQKQGVTRNISNTLWECTYPWVRGQEIRRAAEQLAEEVERAYYPRS